MIFSRTKGWIGVDIGTHTVKLAQVERRGSRVELIEALSIPRQEPWPETSDAATGVPTSAEIQAALSLGRDFRGRDAAVTLPMSVCDLRTCSVGEGTESEQRAAVLKLLDMGTGEATGGQEFDYWSVELPSEKASSGDNTIVLSIASSWATRVAEDMRESGLVGQVLDGLPLTIGRALSLSMPNATNPVAAVDWGHHRATLCCIKSGRPLFVRTLRDCGFQMVTETLCKALSVTPDEAQKLLRDHGLPNRMRGIGTDLQEVIEEVVREPLDRFLDELCRTTNFWSHQRRSIAPTKVVLLGGGASVNNMAGYLNERVEMPVESWSLDSRESPIAERNRHPIELFGPAIALSSLAWAN